MNMIENLKHLISFLTGETIADEHLLLWKPTEYQSNDTYRVQLQNELWIAKVFLKPEEFDDAPRREYETMQLLSPLDIAPRPIHYQKHKDGQKPIVIYEFMAGEMWDRNKPTASELGQLAELWIQMNQVSVEDLWLSRGMERKGEQIAEQFTARFNDYVEWAKINFPEGKRAAAYLQDVAKKRMKIIDQIFDINPPMCFSRADPRFANIIGRPNNRVGMIDWEDAGLRDVARDIADIVVHPNQEDLLSWEEWQAFLDPYFTAQRKVDPNIEMRVQLYHAIFPLFWLSGLVTYGIRLWNSGGHDSWAVNKMNPNLRLRRYLARAIAYPKMEFERELKEIEDLRFFDV